MDPLFHKYVLHKIIILIQTIFILIKKILYQYITLKIKF
jgi:hypothetical protein